MRVGGLFSGIGGWELGLERAGMQVLWHCERDEFCQRVLRKHWPDAHCYSDIRDIDDRVPRVDVLPGGFPCQPISRAGLKLGADDERWMWPEFRRVVGLLRPRYVLVENVPGLLGRGLGDVLGDLAALGYDAEWDCIPALAVGAPHSRDRVWVVAYPHEERRAGRTGEPGPAGWPQPEDGRRVFPYPGTGRRWSSQDALRARRDGAEHGGGWAVEPAVGQMAHGVPNRVDRVAALGNALVPQIAEWIGRRILEWEGSVDPVCICATAGPDDMGNYDLMERDDCPIHGPAPASSEIHQSLEDQ